MLTVYNLIRSLIKEATNKTGGDPLIISFTETLHVIIDSSPQMSIAKGKHRKRMWIYLLELISELQIDRPRRHRQNQRAVKIKMSNFRQKRKKDKSESVNFAQDVEILFQKAA